MGLTELGWTAGADASSPPFAAGVIPARVVRVDRGWASVLTEFGHRRVRVSARLLAADEPELAPSVGDWVALRDAQDGEIEQVLPRTSVLTRRVAGRRTRAQVVAANVDIVFIVDDASAPPRSRRIERYLALAWESGAVPVVLLNKCDLAADPAAAAEHAREVSIGVRVHPVSARTGVGLEALRDYLQPGSTVVLIGASGVGKSSLVNSFRGEVAVQTQEVRGDGKGRHTTAHRELHVLPSGALLIDTPGLREVGLWANEDGLDRAYADIVELALRCQFRDCAHRTEPGCAVAAAIEAGELDPARVSAWVKLGREVARVQERRAGWELARDRSRLRARGRSQREHQRNKPAR